jgi:hypothetical protein
MDENEKLRESFLPCKTLLSTLLPRTSYPIDKFEPLLDREVALDEENTTADERDTSALERSQSSSGKGKRSVKGKRGRKSKAGKTISPKSANSSMSKQQKTTSPKLPAKAVKNTDVLTNELNVNAWYFFIIFVHFLEFEFFKYLQNF